MGGGGGGMSVGMGVGGGGRVNDCGSWDAYMDREKPLYGFIRFLIRLCLLRWRFHLIIVTDYFSPPLSPSSPFPLIRALVCDALV